MPKSDDFRPPFGDLGFGESVIVPALAVFTFKAMINSGFFLCQPKRRARQAIGERTVPMDLNQQ